MTHLLKSQDHTLTVRRCVPVITLVPCPSSHCSRPGLATPKGKPKSKRNDRPLSGPLSFILCTKKKYFYQKKIQKFLSQASLLAILVLEKQTPDSVATFCQQSSVIFFGSGPICLTFAIAEELHNGNYLRNH